MIGKVTKATVEKLPLNAVLWDTALVGFGVRRQCRHPFYLVRYRLNGRQRFHTIGRNGAWTPDTARTEAKRLLGLVATRVDPASVAECAAGDINRGEFARAKQKTMGSKSAAIHFAGQTVVAHDVALRADPVGQA